MMRLLCRNRLAGIHQMMTAQASVSPEKQGKVLMTGEEKVIQPEVKSWDG